MNKRPFFILVLIFFLALNKAYPQIFPRWASGFNNRLFFLKSIDTLRPQLSYYKKGTHDSPEITSVKGYVMDEYDLKNEHDLEIVLEKNWDPKLTMTIDIHFEQLPEVVTYYLEIPKFTAGETLRVVVPTRRNKVIYLDDMKKTSFVDDNHKITSPRMQALDITDIVFPEYTGKKKD